MRILRLGSLFVFSLLFVVTAVQAQQSSTPTTLTRDPQAVSVLAQCLTAAGGAQAMSAIQDFTETGDITYFWAGKQVKGTVVVRGMGRTDFRLDASLQDGMHSWAVRGLDGGVKDVAGKVKDIPTFNAMHLGAQTFPYLRLLAALNDPMVSVYPLTTTTVNGQQLYTIHTQRIYTTTEDPTGNLSKWSATDYLINPATFILSETQETLRPNDGSKGEFQHETAFSGYQQVNGVLVPYSITEKIGGQQTWTIQLSLIQFNTGLTDADFQF
jgi:hypothetical protein